MFTVFAFFALLLGAIGGGYSRAQDDDASSLPEGKGSEEVETYCSVCHSLKIVTQQGLSREAWDELLNLMVEEQGMEKMPPGDRKIVLEYLARHISIERVREMRRGYD